MFNAITDVEGIKVGHATDYDAITGCTCILCERGAVASYAVRGSAAGTAETESLRELHLVQKIHAILLTGGSAFGLEAASGVMQYLEEKKIGLFVNKTYIPIVPSAVIFDLNIGSYKIRPDKKMGYEAAKNAKVGKVEQGSIGAGTGATVGKLYGINYATKAGIGTASIKTSDGVVVGAMVCVNAFGDIIEDGKIIAGARDKQTNKFVNTAEYIKKGLLPSSFSLNTTLSVVATNVKLNREQLHKLAHSTHNAFAKVISPCHTMFDGDTVFSLSYGNVESSLDKVCLLAIDVTITSIINAVKEAHSLGGIPSYNELNKLTK